MTADNIVFRKGIDFNNQVFCVKYIYLNLSTVIVHDIYTDNKFMTVAVWKMSASSRTKELMELAVFFLSSSNVHDDISKEDAKNQ